MTLRYDIIIAVGDLPKNSAVLLKVLKEPEGAHIHLAKCKARDGVTSNGNLCGMQEAREFLEEDFSCVGDEALTRAIGCPKEPGVYRCTLRYEMSGPDRDGDYDSQSFIENVERIPVNGEKVTM